MQRAKRCVFHRTPHNICLLTYEKSTTCFRGGSPLNRWYPELSSAAVFLIPRDLRSSRNTSVSSTLPLHGGRSPTEELLITPTNIQRTSMEYIHDLFMRFYSGIHLLRRYTRRTHVRLLEDPGGLGRLVLGNALREPAARRKHTLESRDLGGRREIGTYRAISFSADSTASEPWQMLRPTASA